MLQISDVKYAMQFNERCKRGQRVIALKMIADFYNSNIGRVKGFKGYLLRESLKDPPSIVNITFWDTKEDMDSYYNSLITRNFWKK
jgi:heme-degrading monooxygenase HmoA